MTCKVRSRWAFALAGLLVAMFLTLFAAPISAQIPDKFTNLKVLPNDIIKQDLLTVMRGFSNALGVRCNHCHAGPEGNPQGEPDWPSDSKPEKQTARGMLHMTQFINAQELPKITTKHPDKVEVKCGTCHHGQPRPYLIEDVLSASYKTGGLDSLKTKYEGLRKKYYGSDTYNFGERMLPLLAEQLVGRNDPDGMLKLAEFNLRWFPDSGFAYLMRGQARAMQGNTEAAMADLKKAVELNPDLKENVQRLMDRLQPK